MASLRAIQARPGVDQLRLAQAIKLDRNTIAGVVRRLQEKKLIARKQDPKDRRSNLLFITTAGEELLAELLPAADRAQRRMLNPLKPAERKLLLELIVRVVNQDISKKHDSATDPLRKSADAVGQSGINKAFRPEPRKRCSSSKAASAQIERTPGRSPP
jgi:DNA-binding MarR family transcriptional regulator